MGEGLNNGVIGIYRGRRVFETEKIGSDTALVEFEPVEETVDACRAHIQPGFPGGFCRREALPDVFEKNREESGKNHKVSDTAGL
jgi:hypothetical protein